MIDVNGTQFHLLLGKGNWCGYLFSISAGYKDNIENNTITKEIRDLFRGHSHTLSEYIATEIKIAGEEWVLHDQGNNSLYNIRKEGNNLHIYAPGGTDVSWDTRGSCLRISGEPLLGKGNWYCYLFSIGIEYKDNIENNTITNEIRDLFQDHSHILSVDVATEIIIAGEEWVLHDQGNNRRYNIKKEGNVLHIHGEILLTPDKRRGAGMDPYNYKYSISPSGYEILIATNQKMQLFWSQQKIPCCREKREGQFKPIEPSTVKPALQLKGLAVTKYHYLAAGVDGGILVFDLYAGGGPLHITWPDSVPFVPFDMAATPEGGILILDAENKNIWVLNKYFQVEYKAGEGTESTIQQNMAYHVDIQNLIAIEHLYEHKILLLDYDTVKGKSTVYYCNLENMIIRHKELDFLAQDFILTRGSDPAEPGKLYIALSNGNQAFTYAVYTSNDNFTLDLLFEYYPMRQFGGMALISDGKTVYYDFTHYWLPLKIYPRDLYKETGITCIYTLDGKKHDCCWHRVFLDAIIPAGTMVIAETRASNEKESLSLLPWQQEPPLYKRTGGCELPYYWKFYRNFRANGNVGTWEVLFQQAEGRYLQIRFILQGNKQHTPWLYACRIYYPRFSYLKEYLPAVYQDDAGSASFLERFLANAEGIFTTMEEKIAHMQTIFGVESAPPEFLEWLAGWLGAFFDPSWNYNRRKLFLAHAFQLFQQRGTKAGLFRIIMLAIHPCPDESLFDDTYINSLLGETEAGQVPRFSPFTLRIVEGFSLRNMKGSLNIQEPGTAQPLLTGEQDLWTPELGVQSLHNQYRTFLTRKYTTIESLNHAWETGDKLESGYLDFDSVFFPPVEPVNPYAALDWKYFLGHDLSFTYFPVEATSYYTIIYRQFLADRYTYIGKYNTAYGLAEDVKKESFEKIELPSEDGMPSGYTPLFDWIHFVSFILPVHHYSHYFKVLVPFDPETDREQQRIYIEMVNEIVKREKPAHTNYIIDQYWALFRVGEACLGRDSIIYEGSRFTALILGKDYLSENYLGYTFPFDSKDRSVTDRDQIGPGITL